MNVQEKYPESIIADGLDEAILGVDVDSERVIYSIPKVLGILMKRDGMLAEDAYDFFEFNIAGAKGDNMPIWCDDTIKLN